MLGGATIRTYYRFQNTKNVINGIRLLFVAASIAAKE